MKTRAAPWTPAERKSEETKDSRIDVRMSVTSYLLFDF
jgi:hypothetical protein